MRLVEGFLLAFFCVWASMGFAVTKVSGIESTSKNMVTFWVDHKYGDCQKMKDNIGNLPILKSKSKRGMELKTNLTRLSTSPACTAPDKQVCFYKIDQLIGGDLSARAKAAGCTGSVEKMEPPFEAAYVCTWDENKPGMSPRTFKDDKVWCEQSVKCPEDFTLFGTTHDKGEYRFLCASNEDHSCPASFAACEVQQLKEVKFGSRSKFELTGAPDRGLATPGSAAPRNPAGAR